MKQSTCLSQTGAVVQFGSWACIIAALLAIWSSVAGSMQTLWFSAHASMSIFYAFVISFGTLLAASGVMSKGHDRGLCFRCSGARYLKAIIVAILFILLLCLISCNVTVLAVHPKGVPNAFPILDLRDKYFLNSHGHVAEVTRSTYLTAGICGVMAFFCISVGASVLAIYVVLFGRPLWMIRRKRGS